MLINTLKYIVYQMLLMLSLLLMCAQTSAADAPSNLNTHTHVKVGVINIPPFAKNTGGVRSGIAFDLWALVATANKLDSEYIDLDQDINKAVEAVERGDIDMAIGPIGMLSSRGKVVQYTVPFYRGEFVLVAKRGPAHFWAKFDSLFSGLSIEAIIGVFVLYFIYLNLFWLFEHKVQPELTGKSYQQAILHIVWKNVLSRIQRPPFFPETNSIRVMALIWSVIFSVFTVSLLAGITASFVSVLGTSGETLLNFSDLKDKKIAIFGGDSALQNARAEELTVMASFDKLSDAFAQLDAGKVDAVYMLRGFAATYINKHKVKDVYISPIRLSSIYLAFIMNDKYKSLRRGIDVSMLKFNEMGVSSLICLKYLYDPNNKQYCL